MSRENTHRVQTSRVCIFVEHSCIASSRHWPSLTQQAQHIQCLVDSVSVEIFQIVNTMAVRRHKEAIHSGHFMVSNFEADEQDEEDLVGVPVPSEDANTEKVPDAAVQEKVQNQFTYVLLNETIFLCLHVRHNMCPLT